MKALGLVVVLLIACGSSLQEDDAPMVETPLGRLRGSYGTSRAGRRYMAFTGIPYAKPPIGELRFKAPEPAEKWEGVLNATNGGPCCPQHVYPNYNSNQGEDCLHLDVFTHNTNASSKAPVLVNMFGGGFYMGFKESVSPVQLMDYDMVIVTPNYRVSIFGFLTFETKDHPGNQGMKDQVMALRWVKDNIASFGGDPDKVTVMGQSAGGASISHLLMSPLARGLYHRAYSTSGSSYNPWAISPPGLARKNAEKLMTLLGCPTTPDEGMKCARSKQVREIADKADDFYEFQGIDPMMVFSPVLEVPETPGAFMKAPLSKLETNPVPYMTAISSAEAIFRVLVYVEGDPRFPNKKFGFNNLTDNLQKNLPLTLSYFASASNPNEVTSKIWDYYFHGKKELSNITDVIRNLTYMYSDAVFNHGIIKGANMHKGPMYLWWFDYIVKGTTEAKYNIGANHCSDGNMIWGDVDPTKEGIEYTQKIRDMIYRFMVTGEPNIPGTETPWPKWTTDNKSYVHFDHHGFQIKKDLLAERVKFWDGLNYMDNFYKNAASWDSSPSRLLGGFICIFYLIFNYL